MVRRFVILLLLFPYLGYCGGFSNEKRSEYILTIAKYVTWPAVAENEWFSVGILSGNESDARKLAQFIQKDSIKGKPVRVQVFSSSSNIAPVDLIYFNSKDSINALDVYNAPACKKTLIVTENYPYQKSMFNFIVVDGLRKFEMNSHRLQERGFVVDPLFSAMAVKNKADWEKLYEQTEQELVRERKTVLHQKDVIVAQNKEIDDQNERINTQREKIKEQLLHIGGQEARIEEQQVLLGALQKKMKKADTELKGKEDEIERRKALIIAQKKEAVLVEQKTLEQKALLYDLEVKVDQQSVVMLKQLDAIQRQKLIIGLFAVLSALVALSAFQLYRAFALKKRSNKALQEKNDYIVAQNNEISSQRDKIALQKKEIMDSIQYASKIQAAMLSSHDIIAKTGADFFVFYRPRDIVSGDFYWFAQHENYLFVAAVDCTGHGVPGAFMSMLGLTFLNDIVSHSNVLDTGEILFKLRKSIVEALNQKAESSRKDGMDIGLCRIDMNTDTLQFSGAYNHCFVVRKKELILLSASKMPVGLSDTMDITFDVQELKLDKGDTFYLYSDGFPDQFGGSKGKKFMSKRFKALLAENSSLPMAEQAKQLGKIIDEWMGGTEQIDDMLVLGVNIAEWKGGSHT